MMTSLQLGQVTSVYGSISTSTSFITTKIYKMLCQYALTLPWRYDNVTTTRSREKLQEIHFHFFKSYNKQIWQNDRPTRTDFNLQVIIMLSQLGHVI